MGRNVEPNEEGRSQVVDRSVYEAIQQILPSLSRIFAGGDNVVEFVPTGPEDEEAAEQESDYLNYLVTQKNNWFETTLIWFQDALLTKNAYCMAFMDEKLHTETESYERQSEEALALLLEGDGVEVVGGASYPDQDADPIGIDELGMPVFPTLYDVQIRRTIPDKRLTFKVLPPENCKIHDKTPDYTLKESPYFEYFEWVTLSDLRAMGFDVDDDIATDEEGLDSEEENARDLYIEQADEEENPMDPALRRVKARTVWIRFDYNDDGIAELQRVIVVGREILFRQEESRIPVASIVPNIMTHRHMGLSVADLVIDVQRIKTAILRQGLDSLYLANNPRTVYNSLINLDDLLVSRPGGVIESEGTAPVQQNFAVLDTPFVFPQAIQGMEYMDQVSETRTGTNRLFQGTDENVLSETASGIRQLSTMAAQRVEQIARIFASSVEYLFSVAHELIIKHGHKSETVRLRGQWVDINPSQWKTGRDMRMVAPIGAGNKDAVLARLLNIATLQEKALAGGLPIVTPDDAYQTALEITKASDFPAPEKFWTDPQQIPPPEPGPDYTAMALQVEGDKTQQKREETEIDAQITKYKADLDAETDRYRADLAAEVDIIVERLKAGKDVNMEQIKARLRDQPQHETNAVLTETSKAVTNLAKSTAQAIKAVDEAVTELKANANAEREIVRDESGKVTGSRIKRNGAG